MPQQERRHGYVELDQEFIDKVRLHMVKEDELEKQLSEGAARMTTIERDLSNVSGLVKTAEGFIKATRIIAILLATLISLYGWIMIEKNNDVKAIQASVQQLTVQNADTLAILRSVVIAQEKDSGRLERHLDAISNGLGGK